MMGGLARGTFMPSAEGHQKSSWGGYSGLLLKNAPGPLPPSEVTWWIRPEHDYQAFLHFKNGFGVKALSQILSALESLSLQEIGLIFADFRISDS